MLPGVTTTAAATVESNADPAHDVGSIIVIIIGSVVGVTLLVAFALGFWRFYTRDTIDPIVDDEVNFPETQNRLQFSRMSRKKRLLRR
jgi:flagellar basal body-associated protein FliL